MHHHPILPLRIPPPQSPQLHGDHYVQRRVLQLARWNYAEDALCVLLWMHGFMSKSWW